MFLLFIRQAIGSYYIQNIFIVNHIQEDCYLDDEQSKQHWSKKQVLTTCNWSSGSQVYNWISYGLNHQIEHHLFPTMNMYLYPIISPIVQKVCLKHRLKYKNYNTFFEAWTHMVQNINQLSKTT